MKIISDGEVSFTYPKLPTVHRRRLARFADGTVKLWSETRGRWVSIKPMSDRWATFNIIWN